MSSRMMECGIPIGFRFFIDSTSSRWFSAWLPSKAILPTFTVGPSLMWKVSATAAGGMVFTSVRMLANWWPCSPSISCNTTSARFTWVGSYWLSTESGTFSFLKRSSTSETEIAFSPVYSMVRMVGFSRT